MGMVDMGFGLEIWEKEKERENWKVADWTEDDEQVMSGATYEWIRMDADFEWIATIEFTQPDFMWVSQLQRDRDVVAQLEVLHSTCSGYCFDSLELFRHSEHCQRCRMLLSRAHLQRPCW